MIGLFHRVFSGAESKIKPSVAEKDNSRPALTDAKGLYATRINKAAAIAVRESRSSFNQKDVAQKTSKITALTTEGENPTSAA